jgi:hypothetical protein
MQGLRRSLIRSANSSWNVNNAKMLGAYYLAFKKGSRLEVENK